jgi:hypothetical protein
MHLDRQPNRWKNKIHHAIIADEWVDEVVKQFFYGVAYHGHVHKGRCE